LQKAAFEGHFKGCLKLAECYKKGLKPFNKDLTDAKKWYDKAVEVGEDEEIPKYEKL
jgi:TPR repeat protein